MADSKLEEESERLRLGRRHVFRTPGAAPARSEGRFSNAAQLERPAG